MLAVERGLRTNRDVAEVLMDMDAAHSSHAYRYVPSPAEGEVVTVYSARPASAYPAIQLLPDQCAADPAIVRTQTKFPEEWPPARLPVHPITGAQLKEWIAEKQSLRDFASPHIAAGSPRLVFQPADFVLCGRLRSRQQRSSHAGVWPQTSGFRAGSPGCGASYCQERLHRRYRLEAYRAICWRQGCDNRGPVSVRRGSGSGIVNGPLPACTSAVHRAPQSP
jgi:hypothetical protein